MLVTEPDSAQEERPMPISGAVAGATRVRVVQPGEGRAGGLAPGVGVVFKIDGADTGGAISVVEHPFAVRALVPPHAHTREDEISYVLEGEIGFRSNDDEVVLRAGGYIIKPRGQVHAMWNAGSVPARMLEMITPAGFEDFFRAFVDQTDVAPPPPGFVQELGDRYGLPFERPAWLAEIIERYSLTPPPGM
jgi:quercetin dioxygenase-like cupin family protein